MKKNVIELVHFVLAIKTDKMLIHKGSLLFILSFLSLILPVYSHFTNFSGVPNEVRGGKYKKFCYGYSSIWDKFNQNMQFLSQVYRGCQVIIGNLVISNTDTFDFREIREVTGYVMIYTTNIDRRNKNTGSSWLDLRGLRVIHGQELGTGKYKDASLIIEGTDSVHINFGELKIVRGNVHLEGQLGCQFTAFCNYIEEFTNAIDPHYKVIDLVERRENCVENATLCITSLNNDDAVCNGKDEFLLSNGECGKCDKFKINGYCVNECPGDTLFHEGDKCVYTCPAGYSYNPKDADFKCKFCTPAVLPETNQFDTSECRIGCFIGYYSFLTFITLREIFPYKERGGMREFDNANARRPCGYLYGNLGIVVYDDGSDKISGYYYNVLSHVKATTGAVHIVIQNYYIPFGTFRNLEYPMLGYFIQKTSFDLNFNKYQGLIPGYNVTLAKKLGIKSAPFYVEIKATNYAGVEVNKCNQYEYEVLMGYQMKSFCFNQDGVFNPTYKVNGTKLYRMCHFECEEDCIGPAASQCTNIEKGKCNNVLVNTHNLKTCLHVCPHGYYQWRRNQCYKCSAHCGRYGCYSTGNILSSKDDLHGCKKCEITVLARNNVGNYVSTCIKVAKNNERFIEEAFEKHLTPDANQKKTN